MIIRSAKQSRFTVVPNAVIDDERLSAAALGIVCYLLSKPDDWSIHVAQLGKRFNVGRAGLRSIMTELRTAGYLVLRRGGRSDGGAGSVYDLVVDGVTGAAANSRKGRKSDCPKSGQSENRTVRKVDPLLNTDLQLNPEDQRASAYDPKTKHPHAPIGAAGRVDPWDGLAGQLAGIYGRDTATSARLGGKRLAWVADCIGRLGRASGNDPAAAAALLDQWLVEVPVRFRPKHPSHLADALGVWIAGRAAAQSAPVRLGW